MLNGERKERTKLIFLLLFLFWVLHEDCYCCSCSCGIEEVKLTHRVGIASTLTVGTRRALTTIIAINKLSS